MARRRLTRLGLVVVNLGWDQPYRPLASQEEGVSRDPLAAALKVWVRRGWPTLVWLSRTAAEHPPNPSAILRA